ncbi:MAG: hypothetical protein OCD00_08780 [Colwellia sp.]
MTTEQIILAVIATLLFLIFFRLGSILSQLQNNQSVMETCQFDIQSQNSDIHNSYTEITNDINLNVESLNSTVEQIKEVVDIYYKYKLPDYNERKLLDQIAIDNEVSEGIARASNKNV